MADRAETQSRIDAALRRAVEVGEVPGVVAMAGTADDTLYEGAFGVRDPARGPAMTNKPVPAAIFSASLPASRSGKRETSARTMTAALHGPARRR